MRNLTNLLKSLLVSTGIVAAIATVTAVLALVCMALENPIYQFGFLALLMIIALTIAFYFVNKD